MSCALCLVSTLNANTQHTCTVYILQTPSLCPLPPLHCSGACPPGSFSHPFIPGATGLHYLPLGKSAPERFSVNVPVLKLRDVSPSSVTSYLHHIWLGSGLLKSLSCHGFPSSQASSHALQAPLLPSPNSLSPPVLSLILLSFLDTMC